MARATEAFGDWPRQEVPPFKPADPPEPARRVVVVDKPDSVQTEVRVGLLGIPRKTTDFMPVDLAIKVLGGEGANRLHRVLRTERGLTYGVSADAQTLKRAGCFVTKTNTRSDATGEVLRLIADEYSRLRRERVGDEELSNAKAYLTGHFPLTIETPDEIATQVLNVLFYELPVQELQTYRQRVNAVSIDDVARVAWKYVRSDRLAVVLVGNAAAFAGQLKGVGFGKYELVKLAELDLASSDFKKKNVSSERSETAATTGQSEAVRPHGPAAPEVDAEPSVGARSAAQTGDSVQALITRAIEAKGGRARLESVKTVEAEATTTLMSPQGPIRTQTTTYIQYPDRFRVEAHVALGTVVQVYAGQSQVWVLDPAKGLIDVPPQVRKDFKAGVDRDVIPLLIRAANRELTARMLPPGTEPKIQAVELSGGGIEPVTLYIDTDSGLVVRESYRLEGGAGNAEELFGDYRDVDGLKVAFRATVRRNGMPVLERTVTSFKVNPALKAGLFDPPAGSKAKAPSSSQATPGAPVPAPPRAAAPAVPATKPAGEGVPAVLEPPRAGGPAALKPSTVPAASEPDAIGLVRKAIDAAGGPDKLKAVRTLRITAANTMFTPQGKSKAESTSYIQYPDRFRVDVRQSGRTAIAILASNTLTVRTPDGAIGTPGAGSEADRSFKGSVQRDPVPLLLRIAAGELRVRVVQQDPDVQQASGERLVQVTGSAFDTIVLGFDATTGLLRRMSYSSPPDDSGPWVDDLFSDYRDVSGVKMPFHSETRRDTWLLKERVVKEMAINPALEPSLFDRTRLK